MHGAFALVSALLLWLGLWQLERADEKRNMLERSAASADAPVRPLSAILSEEAVDVSAASAIAAQDYVRVSITGVWKPENQLLWDNRIADGQAGYEVITPFLTTDVGVVLVNRGWVPIGASRTALPTVDAGLNATDTVSLEAVVTQPSKGLASGPAVEPSQVWPKRLQYLDYEAIGHAMGVSVAPLLLQGRLKGEPIVESWQLHGNWEPTESFGPSRHLGYAFQWFALLATLIFLYLWYELKWFRSSDTID